MSSAFHIPGIFFLFSAFVLLCLVSVSLPFLDPLDIVRVHFKEGTVNTSLDSNALAQMRFGIWADCWYEASSGDRTCSRAAFAYNTTISHGDVSVNIGSSWTRGLVIHPVAAGMTLIAFLFSLSAHVTFILLTSLTAFLAGVIALVAFAIDIALYAWVKHEMAKLTDATITTLTAPAFWMTLASLIVLFLASGTIFFGRRRDRMAGATTYPMASKKSWRNRFIGKV